MGSERRGDGTSIRYFGIMAAAAVWLLAAYLGCSDGDGPPATTATTSGTSVTGAGGGSSCAGDLPDNYCIAYGPAAEDCTCQDCMATALCNGACVDDDNCDTDSGEDCSCSDCFFKTNNCSPSGNNNCDDAGDDTFGECNFNERCTCVDCTETAFCKDNCVNNGTCVPWLEGCSCADCASHEDCGGGTGGQTPGTGGGGGAGGAVAAGGATAGSGGSGGGPSSSGGNGGTGG